VTTQLAKVRAFGEAENISELTNAELPDDEYLGWGMTAVAAKLLGAKGAYRCPGKNGFVYVVYSSIRFAPSDASATSDGQLVECSHHTKGFATYICEHLLANPSQEWFSNRPDEEQRVETYLLLPNDQRDRGNLPRQGQARHRGLPSLSQQSLVEIV
jgi:hypothetical protein